MGMDYFIMPMEEVLCENTFPERLSQFFEQVGGYHEFAEVSQVSKLLVIDLSIFQDIDYDINEEDEDKLHWHPVEEYLLVIDSLIEKIKEKPKYYEQVRHEAQQNSSSFISEIEKIALLQNEQEQNRLANKYERRYPPDYGYLSSNQISADLEILKCTLECYAANGIVEARLFYM